MVSRRVLGCLYGVSVLLGVSLANAQCTKDTDCKGDRVCEAGSCVAGAPLPPAPSAPDSTAPSTTPVPAETAEAGGAEAPPRAQASAAAPPDAVEPLPAERPKRKRHSTGMMVGGIVMTSLSPIALLGSLVAWAQQTSCESFNTDRVRYTNDSVQYDYGYRDDCSDYNASKYGFLIAGVALVGVGVPLIVIGGKKEPATQAYSPKATVSSWAKPNAAGVGLRLDL